MTFGLVDVGYSLPKGQAVTGALESSTFKNDHKLSQTVHWVDPKFLTLLGFSDCWSVYWLLLTHKKATEQCPHTEIDAQSETWLLLKQD